MTAPDTMALTGRLASGDGIVGCPEMCPIERVLGAVGTRSASVLLREAF